MSERSLWSSLRRLVPLAWPVLVGQLALLAFGVIDTVLMARARPQDLAAYAVGSSAYLTVFMGLTGVVMGLVTSVGQLYGARRLAAAGHELHQGVWLALGLAVPGCALLIWPEPIFWIAQAPEEVTEPARAYLASLALALPAALLFTAFRAFNTAISQPKVVMRLQLLALGLKLPLTGLLVFGWPALGLPALGVGGAGLASAVAMIAQVAVAGWILRRDPVYAPFELWGRGLHAPHLALLKGQLQLGLPIGGAVLVEVSGFGLMALFIARLGAVPVGAHQVVLNIVSVLFMLPLSWGQAVSSLVAQRIGAGDLADARRLSWHGLLSSAGVALLLGTALYLARVPVLGLYTPDAQVLAAALPLLAWLPLFHLADAVQTVSAFTLRAWRMVALPMLIYVGTLWCVGLGLGQALAFNWSGEVPAAWQGAVGFWMATTAGLVLASLALAACLVWVTRPAHMQRVQAATARATGQPSHH